MAGDLVPISPDRTADVVGTTSMVDGELAVRVRPYTNVTTRPVWPTAAPDTLANVNCMRFVGYLSPEEVAEQRRFLLWWNQRPWWRRALHHVVGWVMP